MELKFQSKEESNKMQREEFLKLTPSQRVSAFFNLIYKLRKYPTRSSFEKSNNFLIVIKDG